MPRALVHAARTPARENTRSTREQEGRTRKDQRDGAVEAEGAYDTVKVSSYPTLPPYNTANLRREERVETARAEMEILHEAKQPRPRVPTRLPESLHATHRLRRIAHTVAFHACVSEFTLFRCEPGSSQRCVGQQEEAKYSDDGSHGTLDDEEPAPRFWGKG